MRLIPCAAVLLIAACGSESDAIQQTALQEPTTATAMPPIVKYELPTADEIQQKRLDWLARSSSNRVASTDATARN